MPTQPAPAVPQFVDDADDTTLEKVRAPIPEPEQPKHNPRTVDMAEALGLSKSEIEAADPDRLRDYVYSQSIAAAKRAREMSLADSRERDRQVNRIPDQPVRQPEPEDLALEGESDLHPGVVSTLKRLDKKVKEYEAKFGSLEQREKVREEKTIIDVIDSAFEGLGPQAVKFFGEGGVADVPKGSPEHRRRVAVFSSAGINASMTPRQIAKAVKQAATELFGPMLSQPVQEREPAGSEFGGYGETGTERTARQERPRDEKGRFLNDRQLAERQALERDVAWATETWQPSHRRGANEPHGMARATANAAKFLAEQGGGAAPSDSGYGNEDDFPDRRGGRDFV